MLSRIEDVGRRVLKLAWIYPSIHSLHRYPSQAYTLQSNFIVKGCSQIDYWYNVRGTVENLKGGACEPKSEVRSHNGS